MFFVSSPANVRGVVDILFTVDGPTVGAAGHTEIISIGENGFTHGILFLANKHTTGSTKRRGPFIAQITQNVLESTSRSFFAQSKTFTDSNHCNYIVTDWGLHLYKRTKDTDLSGYFFNATGNLIKIQGARINGSNIEIDFVAWANFGAVQLNGFARLFKAKL